ncbi:SulP family inorganic anion transporter [Denitrificimonas caeni]|uniref:SulP family inorganic anion transporter n=1 Tax=Denitrificimonas caeni TaxID=521720 RepID=A0AAF0AJK9_9GAMM|nr:SulP family inorganic anion transporter [Denitrificimonas caeni]WBE26094.1 SulP family inorganic anion transporter [Denitrificimonas caeni]
MNKQTEKAAKIINANNIQLCTESFGSIKNPAILLVAGATVSMPGILIAIGQLRHILGIEAGGHNAAELLLALLNGLPVLHWPTLLVGAGSLSLLYLARFHLKNWLLHAGLGEPLAGHLSRTGPVLTLLLSIVVVTAFGLADAGVSVVGNVPGGLPLLTLPATDPGLALQLLPAAVLISLVGFVESVSVGQTLAAKRRERIEPNQELVGLGAANIAASLNGGFPVTGGFARSVVNYDAGARTPMAGAFTAIGIAVTVMLFTPLFHNLPQAVLAATIIMAVLSLVDLRALSRTWRYSRPDALAMAATMAGVLLMGVETGILMGVGLSLFLFLKRTSEPHIAVVGQLPGSQHFRNVDRFQVVESPTVLSVRVDESLYFPNARYLEDKIAELVSRRPGLQHLVLMCPAVNLIDASALESLEAISERLHDAGIQLHLSEVKGPVMDQLRHSHFLTTFGGQVFVSHYEALLALDPDSARRALKPVSTASEMTHHGH